MPLLAASLLASGGVCVIKNCPDIVDIKEMSGLLGGLGCKITRGGGDITADACRAVPNPISPRAAGKIRSSVFTLGPLLARFRRASAAYPGGCAIGLRPIDLHISGLKALNVKISEENGFIRCDGRQMRGGRVFLRFPSVGATENIMMAAALADGETEIRNAAKEPEIVDLQNFINAMGGNVTGAGTGVIKISGVKALRGGEFTPSGDRIAAGTYLLAAAACGGAVRVSGFNPAHLAALTDTLREAGAALDAGADYVKITVPGRLKALKLIETSPYPGFPTDLQAQFTSLAAVCGGVCVVKENLFETRFNHIPELRKLGADITVRGAAARVRGVEKLRGAAGLRARDLRGGAAIVIAALSARGVSEVENVGVIDRGYDNLENRLAKIGAKIERV